MRKLILGVLLLAVFCLWGNNDILFKTLPNGMQVAVKENSGNTSVGFYCFVKTGSAWEGEYLGKGISHFLEHVVSGGSTTLRSEEEYEELGREMGSLVNAYTSYDVTAYYIITDREYQDTALQVLSEHIMHCVFEPAEVEREKQVILKEIVMRSTPPRSQMYQKQNEVILPNSTYRYPVIGYPELFKTLTRDDLVKYYNRRYVPNNMVFAAAGNFDAAEVMTQIENTFQDFARGYLEPVYLPPQHIRPGSLEFAEEFDVEIATVFLTHILPPADYDDETALNAALTTLFAKRQSPLNYLLVEELKLVNYIAGYVQAGSNAPEGQIAIVFEPKRVEDIRQIIGIIDGELARYGETGFSREDIDNIITRQKASRLLSTPGVQQDCNRMGWNIIRYGLPDNYEAAQQKYQDLTPEEMSAAVSKHLLSGNRVIFYGLPRGTAELLRESEESIVVKSDPERLFLSDNLTLIHRFNNEKPFIKGIIHLPLNTSFETAENAGTLDFMTEMMFSGSRNFDALYLTEWREDHVVSFSAETGRFGTAIEFKCLTDDFPHLLEMILDGINHPAFPETEIQLAKERMENNIKRRRSDAENRHDEYRSSLIFAGDREGLSDEEKLAIILALDREDLLQMHQDYFHTDSAIITLFGDIPREEAEALAAEIKAALPASILPAASSNSQPRIQAGSFLNTYDFEQVNVDICYRAPGLQDKDFAVMKVIESMLTGSRGRIHQAVRGSNDLAYFAFPIYYYNPDYGYLRLNSQTSLQRKDELTQVLQNEIIRLQNGDVTAEDIRMALDERQKMINSYLNDNQLPSLLTSYEAQGLGYDYMMNFAEILGTVTPADVVRVAEEYFQTAQIIVSEPSESVKRLVE